MTEVRVIHNFPQTQALFRKYGRQVPFATAIALNKTAEDAQRYERNHILRTFDVRNRTWMSKQVKHKPRATKVKQWTRLQIDPPGGRKDIVAKFEKRHQKTPFRGKHLAVPVEAKRTGRGRIRANQQIAQFNFRRVGRAIVGDRRTWIVPHGPSAGIYQRIGGGVRERWTKAGRSGGRRLLGTSRSRSKVKLLYSFKRSVPIDNRLNFVDNTKRIARKQFPRRFTNAWKHAKRTAR